MVFLSFRSFVYRSRGGEGREEEEATTILVSRIDGRRKDANNDPRRNKTSGKNEADDISATKTGPTILEDAQWTTRMDYFHFSLRSWRVVIVFR